MSPKLQGIERILRACMRATPDAHPDKGEIVARLRDKRPVIAGFRREKSQLDFGLGGSARPKERFR